MVFICRGFEVGPVRERVGKTITGISTQCFSPSGILGC